LNPANCGGIVRHGRFAFNAFSAGNVVEQSVLVGRAACMTALAGAVGALTASALGGILESRDTDSPFKVSIKHGNNGVLAALVASSAGCATSTPVGMFFTAAASASCYVCASRFVRYELRVDDVVDAASVHGVGGLVGLFAAPLFANKQHYQQAYMHASEDRAARCAGIFYGGDGSALVANAVFTLALVLWAMTFTGGTFYLLHRLLMLRNDVQLGANMDDSQHSNHSLHEMVEAATLESPRPRPGVIRFREARNESPGALPGSTVT